MNEIQNRNVRRTIFYTFPTIEEITIYIYVNTYTIKIYFFIKNALFLNVTCIYIYIIEY